MSESGRKLSVTETLLCFWVLAAPIWYVLQFRPLLALFAAKAFHKS